MRLPCYPLLLIDPYFSVWSDVDVLNESDTVFWTGASKKIFGYVKVLGKTYRFLGGSGGNALAQTNIEVTAFETKYTFDSDLFTLNVSFVSPRNPCDLELLSMPVCYINYLVTPKKNIGAVEVAVFVSEDCCYNDKADVKGGALKCDGFNAAYMGLNRQLVLSNSQDTFSADWGYVYIAGSDAFYLSQSAANKFISGGELEYSDITNENKYVAAICSDMSGKIVVGVDDICSINYFGRILKGHYLTHHTIFDAISYMYKNAESITSACVKFDSELAIKTGGKNEHYNILVASLRQSVAAHKLVEDYDGRLLFLSKECNSNGCIATVDVSYPSSPLYLLYNPKLVWGMLEPIFDFAQMPVWEFDFAPHDVGTYPLCTGQTYGLNNRQDKFSANNYHIWNHSRQETHLPFYQFPAGNEMYDLHSQMPVEECSNMIIMTEAANRLLPKKLSEERLATLKKWADFLVATGLIPCNQLCTDDFAGHLDQNANLSVKAIVAIGAYASFLKSLGDKKNAEYYGKIAKEYADKWEKICYNNRTYSPLTMKGEGAYSLKYNLVFDKLLGLGLFNASTYSNETLACLANLNEYGCPLDERKTYTKSDWLMWMTVVASDSGDRNKIIKPLADYLQNTPTRVPFSDWYDTISAKQEGFRNRTVQGGMFALLLLQSKILLK